MIETPLSLLDRLRQRPGDDAWQRLVTIYTPLIQGWLRRNGLALQDADDLTQDVLGVLVKELPGFQRARPGSFRAWLRTIALHRMKAFWRSRKSRAQAMGGSDFEKMLEQLADPGSGLSRLWDQEHDRHVAHQLLELIEPEFQPITWQAFRRVVMNNEKPARVAAELGVTVNAVWIAKSRVLQRLRQEMQGLVE